MCCMLIHSASAYPRLQARVKRTIAYTPTYDTLNKDVTVDGADKTVTFTLSEEEEDVIFSESSSEEDIAVSSTLVSASVVAFFGIFIMVVLVFGKD